MEITLKQYETVLTIFDSNTDEIDKWIQVLQFLTKRNDIETMSVNYFTSLQQEVLAQLNTPPKAVDSFVHNDVTYLVDKTVLNINTANFRAFVNASSVEDNKRFKSIFSLLVYQEGEPTGFSFERITANETRLDDLPLTVALQVVNFFLKLQKYCIELSQNYSTTIVPILNQLEDLMEH